MGLGTEALVFAHYPMMLSGIPLGILILWLAWKTREEHTYLAWWLILAYSVESIVRGIENTFYLKFRYVNNHLPYWEYLELSEYYRHLIAGSLKWGYALSMISLLLAMWLYYRKQCEPHRWGLLIGGLILYSGLSGVIYLWLR